MTRRNAVTGGLAAVLAAVGGDPLQAASSREQPSMNEASPDVAATVRLLDAFAAAWNRHDLDGLMACMAADCLFEGAAGPDVAGTRHVGRDAVRRAYQAIFDTYPDGRWNQPRHFVAGDRAVTEWTFTGTTRTGTRVEVNGCDIFTLKDGLIAVKNSYRKQRG